MNSAQHRVIPQQVLNPTSLSRCILEGGHTTVSSSENRAALILVLNGRSMVSEESMVERSKMSKPPENPRKRDGDRGWRDTGFQRYLTHNGMGVLVVHEKRRQGETDEQVFDDVGVRRGITFLEERVL